MGLSNKLVGIFNFLIGLLSLPIIGAGIWLATKHDSTCVRFLQWPVIILGVILLVISILGFVGSCFRVSCLLWIYLAIMFLLILGLIAFTVFAFVVTNKGAGEALSGKGFKDYKLGDYNTWLQRQVDRNSTWQKIQSCLSDSKVCNQLDDDYPTLAQFNAANLSPIESGCCKPPTSCNYRYINATDWNTGVGGGNDTDCKTWSNDPTVLCFNCNSCKAGVLQNIKKDWRTVGIVLISTLVVLIAVYSVGCCAFRSARRSPRSKGYGRSGYV
jgi:hypothetical protein